MEIIRINIKNQNPINIPFEDFIARSQTFRKKAYNLQFQKEIEYDDKIEYDSFVQFSKAMQNQEPNITDDNVYGYDLLCDEWEVDEGVRKYALDYLQENKQKLLIPHILFNLTHDKDPSKEVNELKQKLPDYITDEKLKSVPFEVLKQVIDLSSHQGNEESFQKIYNFCLEYLDENQDCSELFLTLDTSKLSYENLAKLVGKPYFDRTKLNDSLGKRLELLTQRSDEMPEEIQKIKKLYDEEMDKAKERDELYQQKEQESELLRKDLKKETDLVNQLNEQVNNIKESILPFVKDTRELYAKLAKDKENLEKELRKVQEMEERYIREREEDAKRRKEEEERRREEEKRRREEEEKRRKEEEERIRKKKEEEERIKKEKEEQEKKDCQADYPILYPNWSTMSNQGWSNGNISEDGWMHVYAGCSNYSSPAYVTVKGAKNLIVSGCSSGYSHGSVFFPVRKNDNLSYNTGSTTNSTANFMRCNSNNSYVKLPDWSKPTPKVWFQQYTAECDGWILATSGAQNGNQAYIRFNGSYTFYFSYHGNNYQTFNSIFFPISKGEQYYAYHSGQPFSLCFIPGKPDTQVGYPDWNKEKSKEWSQQHTAEESGWVYAQCMCYYCYNTSSSNSPGMLIVNGNQILISQIYSNSYYHNGSVFIPVSKGDKYSATGGNSSQSISFFPKLKK